MGLMEDILREKIEPLIEEEGVEMVELEFFEAGSASVLRIYVDKVGGVTVRECADLSKRIGDLLEIENLIPHRYVLEVSSPGLDRPLTTPADFKRKIGERVKIFLKEEVDGKKELRGKIKGLEGENLLLLVESSGGCKDEEKAKNVPLRVVTKAKIMY